MKQQKVLSPGTSSGRGNTFSGRQGRYNRRPIYFKAVPRLYVDRSGADGPDSLENVQNRLKKLDELVKEFEEISTAAMYPVNFFGRRTSCGCCYSKLFHDDKQMGIVLRKAFKGSHLWIPPIQ